MFQVSRPAQLLAKTDYGGSWVHQKRAQNDVEYMEVSLNFIKLPFGWLLIRGAIGQYSLAALAPAGDASYGPKPGA